MDFKILKKREEILKSIKNAVAFKSKKDKSNHEMVGIPYSSEVYRALWLGSGVFFVVPADRRLEKHAYKWLKSKDIFTRLGGVEALRLFKSDENTKLLKSLLNDTDFMTISGGGENKRVYSVRKTAYEILKEWGIEVEKPVLEVTEKPSSTETKKAKQFLLDGFSIIGIIAGVLTPLLIGGVVGCWKVGVRKGVIPGVLGAYSWAIVFGFPSAIIGWYIGASPHENILIMYGFCVLGSFVGGYLGKSIRWSHPKVDTLSKNSDD